MKVILGGKFEFALIRSVDEFMQPNRNTTGHPYYLCINRKLPSSYFERCGTFIAISDKIIVPEVDWMMPSQSKGDYELTSESLAVEFSDAGGREWDDDTQKFSEIIFNSNALSRESKDHISNLDLSHINPEHKERVMSEWTKTKPRVGIQYLCRLFLQIRASAESGAYLVISEEDVTLIKEIGIFVTNNRFPTPFEIPDLTGKIIDGDDFASGLFNFSPHDAKTLVAIRADTAIRKYAKSVSSAIDQASSVEGQRKLLNAMVEAYHEIEKSERKEKAFEIASWLAKPLHYVPGLDSALSIAEDAKDLAQKWMERGKENKEWCLLATRMTEVGVRDYLNRKGNML